MTRRHLFTALALLVPLVAPAAAADSEWQLTPGGYVSGSVEYLDTVPVETALVGSSATLHGRHLYVTTFRSFSIFDVTEAENPKHLSTEHLGVQIINEQPDTNGRILLLSNDARTVDAGVTPPRLAAVGELQVWDVAGERKEDPVLLGRLPLNRREHIWTCVLDCEYAYGAAGSIVSLADPSNPKLVGDWSMLVTPKPTARTIHGIEEVAPGLVLTGGTTIHYLDARTDPANPTVSASTSATTTVPGAPSNASSLPAHLEWPLDAQARHALVSMETPFAGDCDEQTGGFQTYDTTGWQEKRTFSFADEYVVSTSPRGTYTDGRAPHHAFGCSAYGFDVAEHYGTTGQVAVAWFEDGVRLLSVDRETGQITEQGGFVPLGGSTVVPIWRNDEIVYAVDMYRGIDILRVSSEE
jgi:hypothetical protein